MKSISRKLFGLLLVLVMIAGMIPAAAAEEPYELWIGGVQVTGETTSGEGWSFDAASKTLTLTDADITTTNSTDNHEGGAIYADGKLIVVLSGKNKLCSGMLVKNGELEIKGSGSLDIDSPDTNGIYVMNDSMSVSGGCTVKAKGISNGIYVDGDLTVTGSTLTASTDYVGLCAANITIKDSTVTATATATDGEGIYTAGKIEITGTSKVTAEGKGQAIYGDEGISVGEGLVITEPEGGQIDNSTVKVNGAVAKKVVIEPEPTYSVTVTVEPEGAGTAAAEPTSGKKGDQITLKATANEGYIFQEWQVISGGVTVAEDKFTLGKEDVKLKAVFKAVTYTVHFDPNGGEGTMEDATVNYGEQLTLPECGFEAPENQEFDAWDAGKPGDEIDVTGDMTVKALWKDVEPPTPDTFTITFDSNGGSGEMEAARVNAGEKYTLPECGFTAPENQEFDAWDVGKPGDEIDVTGNMTVKALWKDKTVQTFTVTFMSNGGSAVEPQTVNENETAQKPANPSKNGYAFAGWFSDKALTQAYDFASPVTADITLYAKWNPIAYTVKFETDGGSMVAEQMVRSGKLAVKPKDPTKEGFVFAGWYSDKELTQAFDFKTPIAANITLYAKWDQSVKYEVSAISSATVTKGKSAKLEITVKRDPDNDVCFEHFDSVQMDGKELTKGTDYTAKSGSTVITFKNAYLNKLTSGTHTVTILFDDGKAAARIVIKAGTGGGGAPAARTGDESTPGLWIGLLAGSAVILIGLVVFLLLRAKRKNAPSQEAPAEAPAPVREEPEPTDPESKDPESKE